MRDRVLAAVAAPALWGRRVHCGLCGWHGRRWWRGVQCARCRSFPRHRLLPVALEHFGRPAASAGVLLHVGSGPVDAEYLASAGAGCAYRVDLHPLDSDVVGDLVALPVRPGSVDLAVAWHVFEHVADDLGAAAGLHRALAEGGATVASVPFVPADREVTEDGPADASPEDRLRRHGHVEHVRSCGRDYGERLASVGFVLATLDVSDLPAEQVERLGLSPEHVAWCLTRRSAAP